MKWLAKAGIAIFMGIIYGWIISGLMLLVMVVSYKIFKR